MIRKRLFIAAMAACKMIVLSGMHAEATGWGGNTGQVGLASWYGHRFHGRETASGERFSVQQLTAAHRSLPMGTKVLVTNMETDDLVEVKINDRGPMIKQRIIDLSRAAAETIGLLHRGIGQVRVIVSQEALELQDSDGAVYYEVQAGAFTDIEQAHDLLHQLQERYLAVHIATRDGPLGLYHRVRIGPYESHVEAKDVMSTLVQEGFYVFLDEVAASSFMDLHQHMDHQAQNRHLNDFEPAPIEAVRFEPVHPAQIETDRMDTARLESVRFAPVLLEVDRFEPVHLEVDGLDVNAREERVVWLLEPK